MNHKSSAAVLIGLLLLPACSIFGSEEPEDMELVGTVWQLTYTTSLDGKKTFVPPEGEIHSFRLLENGRVEAQHACNRCETNYSRYTITDQDSISIGFGGCTERLCVPNMEFEPFPVVMHHVKTYEFQGNYLRLSTEGDNPPAYDVEEHEVLYFEATECHEKIWFCE